MSGVSTTTSCGASAGSASKAAEQVVVQDLDLAQGARAGADLQRFARALQRRRRDRRGVHRPQPALQPAQQRSGRRRLRIAQLVDREAALAVQPLQEVAPYPAPRRQQRMRRFGSRRRRRRDAAAQARALGRAAHVGPPARARIEVVPAQVDVATQRRQQFQLWRRQRRAGRTPTAAPAGRQVVPGSAATRLASACARMPARCGTALPRTSRRHSAACQASSGSCGSARAPASQARIQSGRYRRYSS